MKLHLILSNVALIALTPLAACGEAGDAVQDAADTTLGSDTATPPDGTTVAETTVAETTGTEVKTSLAAGIYAVAGEPLRLVVPAGALPADWSPTVYRQEPLTLAVDSIGLAIKTGAIYTFAEAPLFADALWLELPYPEVARNEVFVALVWEPALGDWVFVPHAIDLAHHVVYVRAPHFSTLTTAQVAFTTADAAQRLGPGFGVAATEPNNPTAVGLLTGAPVLALGSLYQATAQSMANSAQNAATAQQQMNAFYMASTTVGVERVYALEPAAQSPDIASILAKSNATTSGAGGATFVGGAAAPSYTNPCAAATCAPGTCDRSGTFATCSCPIDYAAVGLTCGLRNEPPTATLDRGPVVFVTPGGTQALSVTTNDPEGLAVTAEWSASAGTFTPAIGAATSYVAPPRFGTVDARVRVSDPAGGVRVLTFRVELVPGAAHRWTFDASAGGVVADEIGDADLTLMGGASVSEGALVLDGIDDYARSAALGAPVADRTMIVRVRLANTEQGGGSAMTLEAAGDATDIFDGIVYGERVAGQWQGGSNEFARTPESNDGPAETAPETIEIAIVYDIGGGITLYRNGLPYGTRAALSPLVNYPAGADVLFGLRHAHRLGEIGSASGIDPYLAAAIDDAVLYTRALNANEIAWRFALP